MQNKRQNLRLNKAFFDQDTVEVAKSLLGKKLIWGEYQGYITETEAYRGEDDPACHAARGLTPRTKIMYGRPGVAYVYFIYGMYYMLNIVTEEEGFPAAVLIRGVKLFIPEERHLDGPGKLCKRLAITTMHNGVDMLESEHCYLMDSPMQPSFIATPRIGIKKGTDKLWRFVCV